MAFAWMRRAEETSARQAEVTFAAQAAAANELPSRRKTSPSSVIASAPGRVMRRSGRLALDPNRLARVHSRFAGQVVTIGSWSAAGLGSASRMGASAMGSASSADGEANGAARTLRFGDSVCRGQLLAVVWSKEVGEKKSDLLDAISQLILHRQQFERLKSLQPGLVPLRQVSETEQQVEADLIAVDRVERTLRSWRVTEPEIGDVRTEAERLHRGERGGNPRGAERWAEVEILAPFDGVLLEKNIAVGDMVETTDDLFKVGDMTSLVVMIDVFEEDLPALESLPRDARRWTVRLKADADASPHHGLFDSIGNIVDPMQHTVAVVGQVENPTGRLRAGQFVTAEIPLK